MIFFRIRISIFFLFFHVQVFSGNRDAVSVVYNKLSQPITTHFVRILPVQWNKHVSMAVEIYGCQGTYVDLYQNANRNTSRHQY